MDSEPPLEVENRRPRRRITDETGLRVAGDDELLGWARDGDEAAFAELYRRHRLEAIRYARHLTRRHLGRDAADDTMAEAVRRVLSAMSSGRGPRTGFRPYLFTAIRSTTFAQSAAPAPVAPGVNAPDQSLPPTDDDLAAFVAMDAFASLPRRWRQVLWATVVGDLTPAAAAPQLGLRPNAVAALAVRAREALRIAFVRQHLPRSENRRCRASRDVLARSRVIRIPCEQRRRLDAHLAHCEDCQKAASAIDSELETWSRSAGWDAVSAVFNLHDDLIAEISEDIA